MIARTIVATAAGGLFGLGLVLGGMTEPAKVLGFLDFFGDWDPSLVFVLGSAVGVYTIVFRIVRPRLPHPLLASNFDLPTRRDLDPRLILGAALFGAGWGLAGLCPGPALTALVPGGFGLVLFILTMLVGMWLVPKPGPR